MQIWSGWRWKTGKYISLEAYSHFLDSTNRVEEKSGVKVFHTPLTTPHKIRRRKVANVRRNLMGKHSMGPNYIQLVSLKIQIALKALCSRYFNNNKEAFLRRFAQRSNQTSSKSRAESFECLFSIDDIEYVLKRVKIKCQGKSRHLATHEHCRPRNAEYEFTPGRYNIHEKLIKW